MPKPISRPVRSMSGRDSGRLTCRLASTLFAFLYCGAAHAGQQGEVELWHARAPRAHMPAMLTTTELRWTHRLDAAFGEHWQATLKPELFVSTPKRQDSVAAWRTPDRPATLRLQQARVGYRQDKWQVRAGKQIFDWSQTDTISPADLLNPRDWSDITRVRKLAVPAVSVRYGHQTSVEWVWIPRQQPSWLPSDAWLPASVSRLLQPGQRRSHDSQQALRLSGNWMQTDWSLVWYRGHANAPDLALEATLQGPALTAFYQPLRAQVLTLARQVSERNMLRLEAARYRQQAGVDFVQYVGSVDQESSGLLNDDDMLYALLQYADSTQRETARNALGWPDFRRVLERNVQVKLSYDPRSDRRQLIELTGTWNRTGHDSYWQLTYQRRLSDNLSMAAGIGIVGGNDDTFWGQYHANNRAWLQWNLKY